MSTKLNLTQIKKNMMLSIFAQIISLFASFIMNIILPKFISEYQYAYWQIYLLYVGYVGVLHFGLLDGIVLRYSQYDYDELDKPKIRSQFKFMFFLNSSFTLFGVIIAIVFYNADMRIILIMVAIGIMTRNLFAYTSYSFQITNRINKYAIMIISYRVFYGIVVSIMITSGVKDFYWYCIADLCSDIFGVMMGYYFNRGLYFGSSIKLKKAMQELKKNVSSGIMLMFANWSSFLLTGSAGFIIQWHWNELVFGKVSFSFSVTNLFLTFITAISVVLFPSLKRADLNKLSGLYKQIRNIISPILIFALIFYYPGYIVLNLWLPVYKQSLEYLGILFPIIVFASKVSFLTNNYLKVYRKEKKMLMINALSALLAITMFSFSAYILDNINILLLCIVGILMIRSIISEIEVIKIIKGSYVKDFIIEILMTTIFIVSTSYSIRTGFCIYFMALLGYIYIYRDYFINSIHILKINFKK